MNPLRYAMCSVTYKGRDFGEMCRDLKLAGYGGVEITPGALADDPCSIPPGARKEYARIIAEEGLCFVGLHWILVAPSGLHVTTPDAALRRRSWEHVAGLIDLCADLGDGGVLVFGSPFQRGSTGGSTAADARARLVDGLVQAAPRAVERGVRILVEPIPSSQTDVVNTLCEAVAVAREVDCANVRSMFDTHNSADETEPVPSLLERYFDWIAHVHVNEMNGAHCGAGNYDYAPLLSTLEGLGYRGWVSVEPFDFSPGPERIARESIETLRRRGG
jgi:sugar phosphate isomerase/epimerase